jgi:lipopolysaccharide transport system ATP-binding protein
MSDVAIRVQNLTKLYRIGAKEHAPRTLGQTARSLVTAPFDYLRRMSRPPTEEETLWALRDVSFEVNRGEVVGIIGRNGAGKSTLLKILSRITEPTSGRAEIHGRVASLLEVGTGFHPELTGRENIYLNGAILGMKRTEINRKFDEIVAFAEIERFLDTPVKRYSSGMYVRLAFAVAAHLEPEILVIDEVLAVGDAAFQKKCLGKMGDVAKEGRTVLFVSHNMATVQRLCPRTILVSSGSLVMDGPSAETIASYVYEKDEEEEFPSQREFEACSAPGDEFVRLRRVRLLPTDVVTKSSFDMDEEFSVEINYQVLKPISNFHLYIRVHTHDGVLAFCSADWDGGEDLQSSHRYPGQYVGRFIIPPHLLNRGSYMLSVLGVIPSVRVLFQESPVLMWRIDSRGGVGGVESAERQGIIRPLLRWSHGAKEN